MHVFNTDGRPQLVRTLLIAIFIAGLIICLGLPWFVQWYARFLPEDVGV
ncbi:MAG: hypothetical protein ABF868_03300 [Sporolactobacillus sp.]